MVRWDAMNDWTRPVLRHGDAHLEVSAARFRIETKHGPMTPASYRFFLTASSPTLTHPITAAAGRAARRRIEPCATLFDVRTMTNLADGTRDKAHANRTETGRRRGSVGHVADDPARHRTVTDRLTSADRRMDEHKPRGRTAGARPADEPGRRAGLNRRAAARPRSCDGAGSIKPPRCRPAAVVRRRRFD